MADAYKHPDIYGALPYLNRFTASGQDEITAYFIPSYAYLNVPGYIDKRGWCEPVRAKSYMEEHVRKPKINDKEAYLICCAETCFNADEALALEGDNKFNKVLLSHQLA